jgi:NAD+ synthase
MSTNLQFAIAQINPVVGDITANAKKILAARSEAGTADLVIFPELALTGYPPEDLVLLAEFRQRAMQALAELAAATTKGPAMLVGSVYEEGGRHYNAAVLLDGGKIAYVQHKSCLPNYGVFDEKRVFSAGKGPKPLAWRGVKLGILVCEDVWNPDMVTSHKEQGAELIVVINASPFEAGKQARRLEMIENLTRKTGLPMIYVNQIGGQDDIVFDGGSFVMSAGGQTLQLPEFKTALQTFTLSGAAQHSAPLLRVEATLWEAMKLGLHDYVKKNNFSGVLLGLSGGIDSALTAAAATDALGAANVLGVLLPSPYTSKESIEDAHESARLLGIETMSVSITPGMQTFDEVLSPVFQDSGWMENISVGGNLQARLRGMTLMAISNRSGRMLLSTGNKSEIAVGYTTLYGDSCGGYSVLKDLYKTQIYQLAHWRNAQGGAIPGRSITKAPSAELAPGQKDEDQLPPYALLDRILYHHIEERRGAGEIIALGFDETTVRKITRMVRDSEYKRRQFPPGVKLSPMLFGKDRRYPLTNRYE